MVLILGRTVRSSVRADEPILEIISGLAPATAREGRASLHVIPVAERPAETVMTKTQDANNYDFSFDNLGELNKVTDISAAKSWDLFD